MRARRISALVAMMAMLLAGAPAAAQPGDQALAERWHQVVGGLEPAAFVSLRLKDGTRVKGTVLGAGDRSFTLMPHTRIPVGSREIPYAEVATLERARQGMSPGLKVLIGAGAGVGGFLLVVLTVIAAYD
jgi:hypothetical protein